jgi:hypothetical protein
MFEGARGDEDEGMERRLPAGSLRGTQDNTCPKRRGGYVGGESRGNAAVSATPEEYES